jgi:hypothetical protein
MLELPSLLATEAAISCANNDVLVLSYTDLSTMTSDSKFDVKRDHFLNPQNTGKFRKKILL